ncbi:MAG TPA: ATP phosphoribosyltransferase, partial [Gammaproteobacteria bacterium]|nr:ATP phosphoribosyltransferase [Gammaproteobacteria bacterium]
MQKDQNTRIKVAVQKSGRLTEHSMELLVRCGRSYSRGKDQLICYGENMPVDVLLVRDDDIPGLVQEDVCDLGIVGLNIIEERRLELVERGETRLFEQVSALDFGQCRLSFGLPQGMEL